MANSEHGRSQVLVGAIKPTEEFEKLLGFCNYVKSLGGFHKNQPL